MYDKPSAPLMDINQKNMIQADLKAFGNKVGVYSNHATVLEAMRGLFTRPEFQPQRDEINLRKKLLREIIGAEIDSTKGLEKPKEPVRFTHFVKLGEDPTEDEIHEKRFNDSLVISKKPYFFRYLYPDLNQQYKKYEASYNEISKCQYRMKFKKLLMKESKTESEKVFIRRYHKFSPLINTNCTMNNMCRRIESIDFDIKYAKHNDSKLPYLDLSIFDVNEEILYRFRKMYQKYSNKKVFDYITYIYDGPNYYPEDELVDNEFRELRFEVIDSVRAEIQNEMESLGLSTMEILTYIKILSVSYTKFNWGFAWDILGDSILSVIEDKDPLVPVIDENGSEYLGRKFSLRQIHKENCGFDCNYEAPEVVVYD